MDREDLLKAHMRLVKQVALKIAARLPPNVELDDLIGSGMIGLLDAVDKFDQAKSTNFKKYAEIRIKGAILDELRAMDHVSRTVRRRTTELTQTVAKLTEQLGRKVTDEDVASHLGMDMQNYHTLLNKLKPVLVLSFEDLSEDKNRDPMQWIADPNARDPQLSLHTKKLRELVNDVIDSLKERQRLVVRFYYYDGMTLKEIGKILGVSESRISQMLTQATATLGRRLKNQLKAEGLAVPQMD
ncbi:MAG: FliA/WhiG family RNA polymerase sigma factor [Myxococcales bacterium]|nr:FliA/WhiG family RNA polymerase sigma factor [Myxococcales bacterium]MCB9732288.1 FliA/WhiG family RNA polymerase sigma factor [Deltaproteobacteria bacterium]